jgi:hypothetical protein
LGSARQALAGQQLAGQTQATQAATAANILKDIASQRAGVGAQLASIGSSGLGQALGAAGQGITAAMTPQDLYNKYASVLFGTPSSSYSLGPTGTNTTASNYNYGIKI